MKGLRDNIRSKDGKPARMDDIRKGEFLECLQNFRKSNRKLSGNVKNYVDLKFGLSIIKSQKIFRFYNMCEDEKIKNI